MRNDLSVIRMCFTKFSRLRNAVNKEHSLVSLQHWTLYLKTYVWVIVADDINLPQKHCCAALAIFI